jgi:hypothetical protein
VQCEIDVGTFVLDMRTEAPRFLARLTKKDVLANKRMHTRQENPVSGAIKVPGKRGSASKAKLRSRHMPKRALKAIRWGCVEMDVADAM